MAWKVYDVYETRSGAIYGPLPCKRWLPVKGARYKVKHKVTNGFKASGTADEYNAGRARAYAEWLARRDGITIPKGLKCRVEWSVFYHPTKKRLAKGWNGPVEREVYCKRIQAVTWGREEQRYNSRKEGRRAAYSYTVFVEELRIEIPNWDWCPAEPVETLDLELAA